jgi:lysosomal alpha-mannosidase
MIDQMSLGLRWLNDTFGVQPNIAWSIDPFGHSSQQASALAQMGMDAFVLGRIDDQDRELRRKEGRMEFVWTPSRSLGDRSSLLGEVTPEGYGPLPGFDVDVVGSDDPFQDRADLEDYNADKKAALFATSARKWAALYGGKQLMVTQGGMETKYSSFKTR